MKRTLLCIAVSIISVNSLGQTRKSVRAVAPPQGSAAKITTQTLPIRRVILYSNGVAYIERRGPVTGHAEINLSFKQSQVDDVLKSMVVLDLGQGRIGAVSYNSSAPPAARMAEIPFAIPASTEGNSGGLAQVLSQLQGARVIVSTATRLVNGSILTVETKQARSDADKPPVTAHQLVIAADKGELSSFDLSEVRSVQLVDEGTRRDLTEFAHAAAAARRRDAKTIVVTSDGQGSREMIISYTVAAPIWKTTYRVVVDRTGKPFFQGWAIVDNVSEEDWHSIQLSLVSGMPISFIQPIQNPVYRYRPIIPLSEDLNLRPQVYEPGEGGGLASLSGAVTDPNGRAVAGATVELTNTNTNQTFTTTTDSNGLYRARAVAGGTYTLSASSSGFKKMLVTNLQLNGGMLSHYNVSLEVGGVSEVVTITSAATEEQSVSSLSSLNRSMNNFTLISPGIGGGGGAGKREGSLANTITSHGSGVETVASGNDVGDLFEYHIDQPITVTRDRSALIPILQAQMEGERVSIFTESANGHRPFSGFLLKNTSPLTLEDGSITVVDGDAYVGEALMERLKPQEERLISFALDLGTLVNVRDEEERAPTFLLRAVNGVIQAHYYEVRKKVYTLVNQTERSRIVYLEHAIDEDEDWELADGTPRPEVKTEKYYRFRLALGPHQKLDFPIAERQERMETYSLTDFDRSQLDLFIARKYIDDKTRTTLEKILDLKSRIVATDARIRDIDKEASEIAQDQQRLRENIKALTATAEAKQLISRYVSKADTQETRLEQLNEQKRKLLEDHLQLQAELEGIIRNLTIDRQLGN